MVKNNGSESMGLMYTGQLKCTYNKAPIGAFAISSRRAKGKDQEAGQSELCWFVRASDFKNRLASSAFIPSADDQYQSRQAGREARLSERKQ
jgi:hypothetical protein